MAKLVVLLLAFLALSEAAPSAKPLDFSKIRPMRKTRPVLATAPKARIVGGQNAIPGQIRYQAIVVTEQNILYGGTLISSSFVLTSGQAISGYSVWTVTLGATVLSSTAETWRVIQQTSNAIPHPSFSTGADLGLIRLPIFVTENLYIGPAILPTSTDVTNTFEGSPAIASGFGVTDIVEIADTLQYVNVFVISNSDCLLQYGGAGISQDDICAFGIGGNTCIGDNGGPLAISLGDGNYKLIGISSFVAPSCTSAVAGGYTRVTSYLTWIQSITGLRDN